MYITRDSYPCTPPLPVSSPDNVWSCVGGVDPFQSSLKHRDKENKRIAKHVDSRSRTQILSTQFMKKIVHSEKFIKKTKSIHVDVNASAPAASLFDVSHKLTSPPYIPPLPPHSCFLGSSTSLPESWTKKRVDSSLVVMNSTISSSERQTEVDG